MSSPKIFSVPDIYGATSASSQSGSSGEFSGLGSCVHTDIYNNWQGASGQYYDVVAVALEEFILNETSLYMLVAKNRALWVGSARDLIEDSTSRELFRKTIAIASIAYEMCDAKEENQRIFMAADILGGHPMSTLHAA